MYEISKINTNICWEAYSDNDRYALLESTCKYMSMRTLQRAKQVCKEWHTVLNQDNLQPIRAFHFVNTPLFVRLVYALCQIDTNPTTTKGYTRNFKHKVQVFQEIGQDSYECFMINKAIGSATSLYAFKGKELSLKGFSHIEVVLLVKAANYILGSYFFIPKPKIISNEIITNESSEYQLAYDNSHLNESLIEKFEIVDRINNDNTLKLAITYIQSLFVREGLLPIAETDPDLSIVTAKPYERGRLFYFGISSYCLVAFLSFYFKNHESESLRLLFPSLTIIILSLLFYYN